MVPRLREAYVLRDAWTKLNVAPAKIMQVQLIIINILLVHLYYLECVPPCMWLLGIHKMLVFTLHFSQQEQVLTELFHYTSQTPTPMDPPFKLPGSTWKPVITFLREDYLAVPKSRMEAVKCLRALMMAIYSSSTGLHLSKKVINSLV